MIARPRPPAGCSGLEMSGLQAVADLGRLEAVLMARACFALVAVLALTGRVRLAGLLDDKSTGEFDPGAEQPELLDAGNRGVQLLANAIRLTASGGRSFSGPGRTGTTCTTPGARPS